MQPTLGCYGSSAGGKEGEALGGHGSSATCWLVDAEQFTAPPPEWLLEETAVKIIVFFSSCELWANVCSAGQRNSLGNDIILGWFPNSVFSVIALSFVGRFAV